MPADNGLRTDERWVQPCTPQGAGLRRILLVSEEDHRDGELAPGLQRQLQGFAVDQARIDELGLSGMSGSCAAEFGNRGVASMQRAAGLPMLSKYLLILVPTDKARRLLSNAMPGLANRIFQIDHFGVSGGHEHQPCTHATTGEREAALQGLGHWSTCLSQLAA